MDKFHKIAARIAEISAPRRTWVIQNDVGELLQIKGRPLRWAVDWYYARTFPSQDTAARYAEMAGGKPVPMDLSKCVKPAS